MTALTSGTTFAVCLTLALTADDWVDKPMLALVGAGVVLGVVVALTGLASGRKRRVCRRNLLPFQRSELALKLKPLVKARAKEKQISTQNNDAGRSVLQKSEKQVAPIHTDEEISKMAGVSRAREGQTQKKTVRRYQHQTVRRKNNPTKKVIIPSLF